MATRTPRTDSANSDGTPKFTPSRHPSRSSTRGNSTSSNAQSEEIALVGANLERSEVAPAPSADRHSRIAAAAYRRAERRAFTPGYELDDWLEAEREIDGTAATQTPPQDQFTG